MSYIARIQELQASLREKQVHGLLIPMDDEHLNEYVVEHGKRLQWLTGFTGSAGEALLLQDDLLLFVDPRYHTQAGIEAKGLPITVVRLGQEGQLPLEARLEALAEATPGFLLALDPFTLSSRRYRSLQQIVQRAGGGVIALEANPVSLRWQDAPALPATGYEAVAESYTGASVAQKLAQVRADLPAGSHLLVTKLDQIAWLLNLRGADIPYNPVFVSYAIVGPDTAEVFCDLAKLPAQAPRGTVRFRSYAEYADALRALPADTKVVYDPDQVTQGTVELLKHCLLLERRVPTFTRKARKTEAELSAMRQANLKASRAKIRAMAWLEGQLARQEKVSEASFARHLERLYAEEADYRGQSFRTISAAGANSAVVHYGKNSPEVFLREGEFFLIDSGAQYLGGTTDDTRTLAIGEVSAEHKRVYTSVLQAHLALAGQLFPAGTVGGQLDAITRAALWRQQLSYGHGTGHGVGAYLNVHEGPNRIAWPVMEPLLPGMVTSNEPGAYREGWGGVRIENLMYVVERGSREGISWLGLENLTFIPYDRHLIDKRLLSPAEVRAIDRYHADVRSIVGRTLSGYERDWLERACAGL